MERRRDRRAAWGISPVVVRWHTRTVVNGTGERRGRRAGDADVLLLGCPLATHFSPHTTICTARAARGALHAAGNARAPREPGRAAWLPLRHRQANLAAAASRSDKQHGRRAGVPFRSQWGERGIRATARGPYGPSLTRTCSSTSASPALLSVVAPWRSTLSSAAHCRLTRCRLSWPWPTK